MLFTGVDDADGDVDEEDSIHADTDADGHSNAAGGQFNVDNVEKWTHDFEYWDNFRIEKMVEQENRLKSDKSAAGANGGFSNGDETNGVTASGSSVATSSDDSAKKKRKRKKRVRRRKRKTSGEASPHEAEAPESTEAPLLQKPKRRKTELDKLAECGNKAVSDEDLVKKIEGQLWRDRVAVGRSYLFAHTPHEIPIGNGLFAKEFIPKGIIISDYPDSQRFAKSEYMNYEFENKMQQIEVENYLQEIDCRHLRLPNGALWGEDVIMFAHDLGDDTNCVGHLINHSPHPGCQNVLQRTKLLNFADYDTGGRKVGDNWRPCLLMYAKRNIRQGEELLRDYGKEYRFRHGICYCPKCGKFKRSRAFSEDEVDGN